MKANEIKGQPNKIEASTKITGEIKSNADFRIDGYLNGSITTSGKVVVGKEGIIEGNIKDLETSRKITNIFKPENIITMEDSTTGRKFSSPFNIRSKHNY